MTQPQDAANALLMSGGIKSIGWKENGIGYTVVGTIVDQPKAQQMTKHKSTDLAFWPSGDPMMEIVLTIQTELRDASNAFDEGKRHLHITPRMMATVRTAVQAVSAPGLAIGGRIAVKRTGGTGETGSPFEFAAEYAAPAVDPAGLLSNNGAQPTAAPAQTAPMIGNTAPPAAAPAQGSLMTPVSAQAAPTGVDPARWAVLNDVQRQAVLAAMAPASAGFGNEPPF